MEPDLLLPANVESLARVEKDHIVNNPQDPEDEQVCYICGTSWPCPVRKVYDMSIPLIEDN